VPLPAWGIWVGEVAHHLRSAIDNTVTVLTLWTVPDFSDAELGCQLIDVSIS